MRDFIFEEFANGIESSWGGQVEVDELPVVNSYTAILKGRIGKALPKDYQRQKFLEKDLEPICKLFHIEFPIAVQLLAIRRAWLGFFDTYVNLKITNGEANTIVVKDNVNSVRDFLILNSPFWTQHPDVSKVLASLKAKELQDEKRREERRKQDIANSEKPYFIALRNMRMEQNSNDIEFCINELDLEEKKYQSPEDAAAWHAQLDINKAQRKISNLQNEIEKLNAVIMESERVIRRYKAVSHTSKALKGKGRPVNDEIKVNMGKKFVSKWVTSLMEILEVTSCQKLEQLINPYSIKLEANKVSGVMQEMSVSSKATERNWRRWLNGEAVPNYNTFIILMRAKIEFGKYSGKQLQEIPTTPDSSQIQALLRFI